MNRFVLIFALALSLLVAACKQNDEGLCVPAFQDARVVEKQMPGFTKELLYVDVSDQEDLSSLPILFPGFELPVFGNDPDGRPKELFAHLFIYTNSEPTTCILILGESNALKIVYNTCLKPTPAPAPTEDKTAPNDLNSINRS